MQEMLFKKGVNWDKLPVWQKRGRCFYKKNIDKNGVIRTVIKEDEPPIFSQDRDYITKYVFIKEVEK
ncbi:MAG: hypothetical protein KAX49_13090 [Halanaerobiales bacterium]|nr:hypothetical protein [Halanaerobiales bacterium]